MKVSKVLIEQDEIEQKVKELAERINNDYSGEELVIVGILKGAFIVISDLAAAQCRCNIRIYEHPIL